MPGDSNLLARGCSPIAPDFSTPTPGIELKSKELAPG